jgi:hypothetical protein
MLAQLPIAMQHGQPGLGALRRAQTIPGRNVLEPKWPYTALADEPCDFVGPEFVAGRDPHRVASVYRAPHLKGSRVGVSGWVGGPNLSPFLATKMEFDVAT